MMCKASSKLVAAYFIGMVIAYGASAVDRVHAQEIDSAIIEEIVVVGTRADLEAAIDFKRHADTIVDAISASDIGKMPDQNIADSLQRVPGVQIQRNRGQAEEITIRGLPGRYTQTLVNGRPITTVFSDTLNNRNFQAYIMPSAFVSRLAVYKSGKADVQEGGIAGSVDIVTQRALEIGERRFNLSGNANWDGNNGEIGSDLTAIYADIFANDTLGIVVGVNLVSEDQGLHRDRGGAYRRTYNEGRDKDLNGDGDTSDRGLVVRDNVLSENFEQQRDRQSYLANAEWQPSDGFSLFGEVLYSQQDTISPRESVRFDFRNKKTVSEGQQTVFINDVEYVSQYHSIDTQLQAEKELQDRDADLLSGQILASFYLNPRWSADISVSRSQSNHFQTRARAISRLRGVETLINMEGEDRPTAVTVFGDEYLDPDAYTINQFNSGPGTNIRSESSQDDFKIDIDRLFDAGFVHNIGFGVSLSDSFFASSRDRFAANRGELGSIGIDSFPMILTGSDRGGFLDSADRPTIGDWLVPDIDAVIEAAGGIEAIVDADGAAIVDDPTAFVDISEDFTSAYLILDFGNESGRIAGNIGVRHTQTDETVQGTSIDLSAGFTRDEIGDLTANAEGVPVTRGRSYSNTLPSLNLRFDLGDNHVVRFAAAKTMTRPSPAQLDLIVSGLRGSIDSGNEISYSDPNLEPFLAKELNLAWSWYYGDENLFSTALFSKDLESLIGSATFTENFDVTNSVTGETTAEAFQVDTDSNSTGVTLRGFEVSWQHALTQLPGPLSNTGLVLNYTYIDNSAPKRLRAAAEDNYNVIAYYDGGRFDVRLSYTYRGEYLLTPATGLQPMQLFYPRQYLSASLNYRLPNGMRLRLAGANLTDEADVRHHEGLIRQYIDYGRRISLSIRGNVKF
jgi:iron complex outermembrane receptor protein